MPTNEQIAHELAVAAAKIMLENSVRVSQNNDDIVAQLKEMARIYRITRDQMIIQLTE